MNDANATILAYLVSFGLLFSYGLKIAFAHRHAQREQEARRVSAPPLAPVQSVTAELKPRSTLKAS